jgi:hypothetical protein
MTAARRIRIAALLFIAEVGFGLAMPGTLAHLARTAELPMTPFGFRAFSGPFEQLGTEAFTALGWALVVVSALDVVAGVLLWQRRQWGARLGVAMTPFAFALGIGFALPFLLLMVPIRLALVLASRRELR